MLGSAKGGYSKKESFNLSSIVSNTVRRMSGHTLDHEESEGEVDINKGASDMEQFKKNCRGVPIVTHLKPYRIHQEYNTLVG
jgi:hypothetical protein